MPSVIPVQGDPRDSLILTVTCPDGFGITAAVSGYLYDRKAFITETAQYSDPETGRYFMRTVLRSDTPGLPSLDDLRAGFEPLAARFKMTWKLDSARKRVRMVIAVSKFGHCLNDLLHRWRSGLLNVDIPAIISNHPDMAEIAEWHQIPYYRLEVTPETKALQEKAFLKVVEDAKADLVVLARYMQILSKEASCALSGRCINIHHSFLPGFKGAKPYHQAHNRGVKLIGATAHYVTDKLDEGPIIEQEVARVDHKHMVRDLVNAGRDMETLVLGRAVRWHVERRIMINGARTVIFQ